MWDESIDFTKLELIRYYDKATSRHEQIELFEQLTPHWEEIARRVGLNAATIGVIRDLGRPDKCLTEVLARWQANTESYPATWKGVYRLLNDSKRGNLAKKLQAAIKAEKSNFRDANYEGED